MTGKYALMAGLLGVSALSTAHAETTLVADTNLDYFIRTFENGAFTGEIVRYPYLPELNGLERDDQQLGDMDGDGELEVVGVLIDDDDFQVYFHEIDDTDGSNSQIIPQRVNHVFDYPVAGDINGDGTDDLVFFRENGGTDGVAWAWIIENGAIVDQGPIGHSVSGDLWTLVDVADINSDGTGDVIWQEMGTGRVYTWLMQEGRLLAEHTLLAPDTMVSPLTVGVWDAPILIEAVCDVDGDGVPDLINSNEAWDEQFRFWKIQNGQVVNVQIIENVFSETEIAADALIISCD